MRIWRHAMGQKASVVLLSFLAVLGMMDMAILGPCDGLRYGGHTDLASVDASFHGELAKDYIGNSTQIVGDVNGDGYDDILIGGGGNSVNGPMDGETYLVLGKRSGWATGLNVSSADSSFIGENPGDYSGFSVSGAGDINGDGYDDFLIGAPFHPGGGSNRGMVYVFLGRSNVWPRNGYVSTADALFVGEMDLDLAGFDVSGAGDVNGDGYDDFIIGALNGFPGGYTMGKVYLVFGSPTGWSGTKVLSEAGASFFDDVDFSRFGTFLARAGDVNGDGLGDFLIGAFNDCDGGGTPAEGTGAGKTYLVLGKVSGWKRNANISSEAGASFIGERPDSYSGMGVGGAGDLNRDGLDDIIIGSPRYNISGAGGPTLDRGGKVHIILGKRSGWTMRTNLSQADASFRGEEAYDALGTEVDGSGDLDGDGYDDIVMSTYLKHWQGFCRGAVYVKLGSSSINYDEGNVSSSDASFAGQGDNEYAGWSLSSGGDVNGDGLDDIVIGAPGGSGDAVRDGLVYVVFPCQNSWPGKVGSTEAYSDALFSNATRNTHIGGEVFIELTGTDGDPSRRDVTLVNVTTGTGPTKWFWLRLRETGNSTGKYRGSFHVSGTTDEDTTTIGAQQGSVINVLPLQDPTNGTSLLVGLDAISVDAFSVSDDGPTQGAIVNLTAVIGNHGPRELRDVALDFTFVKDNGTGTGNGTVFATRTVTIPKGGSEEVSVDWDTTGLLGDFLFRCIADGGDVFDEANGTDNMRETRVTVITSAVLTVSVEKARYEPLEEVRLTMTNSKGAESVAVSVMLPDGSPFLEMDQLPDAMGFAESTFVLPAGHPVGVHEVRVSFEGATVTTSFEVVNDAPEVSLPPDIEYKEGTTGHNITWICLDMTPVSFIITRDLEVLVEGPWDGGNVTVPMDGLAPGNHTVTLQLTDLPGNTASDSVTVTVLPNLRPLISILEPLQSARVWGNVTVKGVASDPDGEVVRLEAKVDNGNWTPVQWDGSEDWQFDMDTDLLSNGQHIVTLRATDDLGGSSDSYTAIEVVTAPEAKGPANGVLKISQPVVMTTAAVTVPAILVLVAMAFTDLGRWTIFKLLFLAGYSKRKDEQVLDNFVRGWIQGVVVRDPGIRPVDIVSTFEGKYSANLVYYHLNELIKFGYLYMVQRDRHGEIVRIRRGVDGRVVETDNVSKVEARTALTLRPSKVSTMTLHIYPTDILAPKSQLTLRKKQRFLVYKYIAENPGVSQLQLSEALDMMRQAVAYHLKELQSDGLLIVGSEGRKKYYYIDKEKAVDLREDVVFPEEEREGKGVPDRSL